MKIIDKAGNPTEAPNKDSEDAKVTIERGRKFRNSNRSRDWTPKDATRGPVEVTFTNNSTKRRTNIKIPKK